jgi:hypothetical protein
MLSESRYQQFPMFKEFSIEGLEEGNELLDRGTLVIFPLES